MVSKTIFIHINVSSHQSLVRIHLYLFVFPTISLRISLRSRNGLWVFVKLQFTWVFGTYPELVQLEVVEGVLLDDGERVLRSEFLPDSFKELLSVASNLGSIS